VLEDSGAQPVCVKPRDMCALWHLQCNIWQPGKLADRARACCHVLASLPSNLLLTPALLPLRPQEHGGWAGPRGSGQAG
jgi:hypothetical protein